MAQHQVLAGSLGSWVRTVGSGFSGIQAAPTPTGWAKRESMTLNLQSHHQQPSPLLRTRTQRTTQVSLKDRLSRDPHSYRQSVMFK